jgi:hypothetical protein
MQHTFFAMINRLFCCFILFVCVLLTVPEQDSYFFKQTSFVRAAPIQILSLEYTLKPYQLLDVQGRIAVLNARLDQSAFVDRSCSPSPTPSTTKN